MLKEYCDKCKREIDHAIPSSKKYVKIVIPGYGCGERYADLTLCNGCFKELGIYEAVSMNGTNKYCEKEPKTVDRLMDIIRELVAECVEEQVDE